jgi:hypothetical protein
MLGKLIPQNAGDSSRSPLIFLVHVIQPGWEWAELLDLMRIMAAGHLVLTNVIDHTMSLSMTILHHFDR